MATAKITLSASRDIPFNKLVLSQSNVRRVKAGISIDELAEDIARRSLLQSLNVRPVLDGDGRETGMFEVPAGGRRYRALELLVKQKRMNKTQPVPVKRRWNGTPYRHPKGALTQFWCSWFIQRQSVWPEADQYCHGRTFGAARA